MFVQRPMPNSKQKNSNEKNSKYLRKIVKKEVNHASVHSKKWPGLNEMVVYIRCANMVFWVRIHRNEQCRWSSLSSSVWFVVWRWRRWSWLVCMINILFFVGFFFVFLFVFISLQVIFTIFNEIAVSWFIANISWTTVWIFQTTITANLTAISTDGFFWWTSV